MSEVTVATVQMKPILNEMEDNLIKMSEFIATICSQQKVDVIVFPELITSGYEGGVRFTDLAQHIPGASVNIVGQRAAEFGVHIVFGMPSKQKVESVIYNSVVMVGPTGELIGEYRKIHLKGEERMAFRPGLKYPVFETELGRVGLLIGYDLAFPEAARSLSLDGAELILASCAWESPHNDEFQTYVHARALENAVFVAAANRVGEDVSYSFFGESMIVGPRGQVYASLAGELDPQTGDPAEGYAVAHIDLREVRRNREEFQTLQNRAPETYRSLVRRY